MKECDEIDYEEIYSEPHIKTMQVLKKILAFKTTNYSTASTTNNVDNVESILLSIFVK